MAEHQGSAGRESLAGPTIAASPRRRAVLKESIGKNLFPRLSSVPMVNLKFISEAARLPGPDPLALITRLADGNGDMAALHSADTQGETIIGCDALLTWTLYHKAGGRVESTLWSKPAMLLHPSTFAATGISIHAAMGQWQMLLDTLHWTSDLPHFNIPRWIGFIAYDVGRLLEDATASAVGGGHWPLMRWQLFARYYHFEKASGTWRITALNHHADSDVKTTLMEMHSALDGARITRPISTAVKRPDCVVAPNASTLRDNISRIQKYIAAGDIYQANLAVQWTLETSETPMDVYRRLCFGSAAPYAAFLRFGERSIISASPELFLQRRGPQLRTEPIKGTRPRRPADQAADEAQRQELLQSPKDQAELHMITDLLRNDLGKICRYNSVRVAQARAVQAHPTVWHTSSTVTGTLVPDLTESGWAAIVKALCPGGSITGAPKIRAMQVIDSLEGFPRELYCGHIGWINGPDGVWNITIRTILMQGRIAKVYAGAGIVADSDPADECREIFTKAMAPLHALGMDWTVELHDGTDGEPAA